MIVKRIIFLGQPATHACDGTCNKAWGRSARPRVQIGSHVDDYAYLADHERGEAPTNPGTFEGEDCKPVDVKGPDDVNKWCVRECERAWISPPGRPDAVPDLPDFSTRLYNVRPRRRTPA